MKYFLKIAAMFFLVGFVTILKAQEKPKMVFDKLSNDFGSFKEDAGVQSTDFVFTNKGTVPLVLNNVQASCGCTTPEWTREPVAPGKTGKIKVSYDPRNRPGAFSKTVTVQSNAETPTIVLTISGTVRERELTIAEIYPYQVGVLRAKSSYATFARVLNNETQSQSIELYNDTEAPVKVGIKQAPPYLKATIVPETMAPKSKAVFTVVFSGKEANTYGFVSNRIYLSLNGSDDYNTSLGVSASVEEDFSKLTPAELANAPVVVFEPVTHDFGDIKETKEVEFTFTIKNVGKADLIIRNVRASCGCTAVSPSKSVIKPGEIAPVKTVFNPSGKRGKQSKSITVITNDPKNPTVNLFIESNVLAENQ